MTSEARRPIYFGSRAWEAESVNAAVLARMEQRAAVRIAVGELEAARQAAEASARRNQEMESAYQD
jgi:alkyl sulfatase BDS1-like metallo-beta-lactamase superfamily hydrolase